MVIYLALMVVVVITAYSAGENGFNTARAILIIINIVAAMLIFGMGMLYECEGTPKSITRASGVYSTISRTNDGETSYSIVKDAKGDIYLLQSTALMPNYKVFVVKAGGEVSEFK